MDERHNSEFRTLCVILRREGGFLGEINDWMKLSGTWQCLLKGSMNADGQSDRERTGRHVSLQANLNRLRCDVPGRCPSTATREPHIELSSWYV